MQNKGFVKVFAILLTLVCVFYLSFSFVTRHYNNKAKEYAKGDLKLEQDYLDSLSNEKVWFGNWTLKQCREMEISLGLDLKGGMNVILEVSVPDVIKALADNKTDEAFNQALATAAKQAISSQDDVITLFVREYHRIAPDARLSELFATQQLKDKVNQKTPDAEVEKVLRSEVKAAVDNSYNVLRTRIDRFGVVQPNIQSLEDKMGRIMVELPGIKEPERVRKLLQGSANLEFWETYNAKDVAPYLQAADNKLRSILANEAPADSVAVDSTAAPVVAQATSTADSLAAALKGESKTQSVDLAQIKKEHPLLAVLQINSSGQGPVVAYANYKDTADINRYLSMKEIQSELPKDLRLKWGVSAYEYDPKGQTFELYAIRSTERNGRAPLEGDVVVSAKDEYDQFGKPAVSMSMNTDGSRRWAQLTKQNIGKSIAIVLDGYVCSSPNVNDEIKGGSSQISGQFDVKEAQDLANILKSGKLPAPARIIADEIVGPSLGSESIQSGMWSFVIAFGLVLIYMLFFYSKGAGLAADIALFTNLFFLFGVLASIGAVLTLPGIAGIVLTMGMSVDANVLIYERIQEELRAGKGLRLAIKEGYKQAYSAIIDGNVTTLLTGFILYYFGEGPIKGFATTLIIGIFTSLFCAIFITRIILDNASKKNDNVRFTTPFTANWLQDVHFPFLERRKVGYTVSGIITVVCLVSMFTRGFDKGIDFVGGRTYTVAFDQPVEVEKVAESLAAVYGSAPEVKTFGGDNQVRITTKYKIEDEGTEADDEVEALLYEGLKSYLPDGTSKEVFLSDYRQMSQKVGPAVAEDVTRAAIWSVIFALLVIFVYIMVRFSKWQYGAGAVLGLAHNTIVVLGLFSLLAGFLPFSLEIDQAFIAAILTVVGYSINDTVVVFDRIREYHHLYPKRDDLEVTDSALNSTLRRTFSTSLSTLVVLLAIFIFGGTSIKGFVFALLIGIIVGTYSSLFVATPLAYEFRKRFGKKETTVVKK